MELSDDAAKMIEKRANKILKGIDVPEGDKDEIRRELVSNYVEASSAKAQARGATLVEGVDVAAAFETSSDPEEIASMYMASYVKSLRRAGLLSRTAAYVIDMVIATALTVILASPIIAIRIFSSPVGDLRHIRIMVWSEYFYLVIYLNLIVIFIYFVVCEGFRGSTPGKWALGLKVLREDGKKADYKEAMLRTIPKLFIVAIAVDALLMVLYRAGDRQRIFDRIAGTIVIRK